MLIDWCSTLGPAVTREMDGITIHQGTLSETLARLFRTETSTGRAVWTATVAFGAVILWDHIIRFDYSSKAGA